MSIPPLPNRTILTPAKHTVWGYTIEQMQADRKQVWEAALEEAVDIASKTCHHESTAFANGFNSAAISIEKQIRNMQ